MQSMNEKIAYEAAEEREENISEETVRDTEYE